jgi:hypothetical protein
VLDPASAVELIALAHQISHQQEQVRTPSWCVSHHWSHTVGWSFAV